MNTVRKSILTQFATLWAVPNATVYRSRETAIARVEGSAVVIRPQTEQVEKRAASGMLVLRDFTVAVSVIVRGDPPDDVADPIIQAGNKATLIDPTLGGLCAQVIEHSTEWKFEEADLTALEVVILYMVRYQTSAADLSTTV
jgi:hypothetical protein